MLHVVNTSVRAAMRRTCDCACVRACERVLTLQELMQQMAGVETQDNLTEEQLEAMAGGEVLRLQAASMGQMNKSNKAWHEMRDAT